MPKTPPSTIAIDALRKIVRALRQADAKSHGSAGVPSAQLFVLRALHRKPALSITELSSATITSQSSVSEVVARLESNGLVRRTRASDDARRAVLSLTSAGRQVVEDSPAPFQERLVSALRRLSAQDQEALARGMTAWLEEAGITDAPAPMFFEPDALTTNPHDARRDVHRTIQKQA